MEKVSMMTVLLKIFLIGSLCFLAAIEAQINFNFPGNNNSPGRLPLGNSFPGSFPGRFPQGNNSPGRFPGSNGSPGRFPGGNTSPGRFPGSNGSPGRFPGSNTSPGRFPGSNGSPGRFPVGNTSPGRFPGSNNRPGRFPNGNSGGGFPQTPRPHVPAKNEKISGCNCIAERECGQGFGQLKTACVLEGAGNGICCIPQAGVVLTRVGFSSSDFRPVSLNNNIINQGVKSGKEVLSTIKSDEQKRLRNRIFLKRGTPERGHAFFFQRRESTRKIHKAAYLIGKSSVEIAKAENLTPQQAFFGLPDYKVSLQQRTFSCPREAVPRCNPRAKYRTIDGTCNNLGKPLLGKSETAFARLGDPLYNDGIMEPRTTGVDGNPLPNVRVASNNILLDVDSPDREFTLNLMQWAQFTDHDLTHSPFADMEGEAIMCCENGVLVNPQPSECFPIDILESDGFFGPRRQKCINFVRSMLALNENCAFGPVEQLNALTHWVDGSMIYGSTEEEEEGVVDRSTGFMKTSRNNLPPINRTIDCEARIPGTPCFVGGDSRITEQPALTAMHTYWIREHNRIATIIKKLKPRINANELFEETRRIVIAEVQHITYNEYLPIIIGKSLMRRLGIETLSRGFRNRYDPSIDPRMFNEFATAAYRFGHSLVQGLFRLISQTGRQSTTRLRDTFNAPNFIMENPQFVDDFARSLTNQKSQTFDNFITRDLTNHLFQTPRFDFGMDLMSLNIQRGRDHAIATYNQLRSTFGLGKAKSFADLKSTTSEQLIRRIQTVYQNVDDIDLFVGGMTEKPLPDALLGPLFANIVGRQFQLSMNGDRFFYDLGGQPGSFTPEQLQEIRKISMAKIFCDTSKVDSMQRDSFRVPSRQNPVVSCNQIPGIDLSKF